MIMGLFIRWPSLCLCLLFLGVTLTNDYAYAAKKKTTAVSTNPSGVEVKGFAEIGFDDGVLQIVSKLKAMGVEKIKIDNEDAEKLGDSEILNLFFHDKDGLISDPYLKSPDTFSLSIKVKDCLETAQYEFSDFKYCGFNGENGIEAQSINVNGIPYKIRISFTTSKGYPVLHFNNAGKLKIASKEYSGLNMILTQRISSIMLIPISPLTDADANSIKSLYKSKYSSISSIGSNSYRDKNGREIQVNDNGVIDYRDFISIKNEERAYTLHRSDITKKMNSTKKDTMSGI